ncbi:tail fiber assembly protein [Pseudomonas nunensis]|uniref:Tail fiber assembly protein n=1 Tax=Pseudomonas nunensis TaxID=2961896 RepID=A0ABY5ED24_9PSED|nr:tail fiber assembly protein [Pseudomonas nunensis]MCL5229075.1 tail fiber assembly protein [Pseudomonas nunensis]UTO12717.1 tail fiber assembly protein [Pseudomonas nunensis]
MFASKSARGFYDTSVHTSMPDDVIEISAEYHAELLAGQGEGQVISWGDDGYPLLIDPPLPSTAEVAFVERIWRDGQLAGTDNVVARHRDEAEEGSPTTLTKSQYIELQAYRRLLRNWPESGEFPLLQHRPPAPEWLSTLTQ